MFDDYTVTVMIGEKSYTLKLHDTHGMFQLARAHIECIEISWTSRKVFCQDVNVACLHML